MQKLKALALRGRQRAAAVGATLALAGMNAMAAIDTTDATTDISAGETAVLAIGASILGIFVGIFLYKAIRRVF
ncbi:MAG: major capsid protein [Hydrogenophaga sp.]|nr:major capsid protein [Hydrogenophaga sp.]